MPVTLNFYCLAKYVTSQVLLPQAKTSFGWKPWSSGYGRRLMFESSNPSTGYWMNIFYINLRGKTYCFFKKKTTKRLWMAHLKTSLSATRLSVFIADSFEACILAEQLFIRKSAAAFVLCSCVLSLFFWQTFNSGKSIFKTEKEVRFTHWKDYECAPCISVGANNG